MNSQSQIPWKELNSEEKIERLHEETKELFSRVAKLNDHTFVDNIVPSPTPKLRINIPCLECGKMNEVDPDGLMALGVLNVFCYDKDCEDIYASKL